MSRSASENYLGVWGNRIGFGEKPAVLVIDFMKACATPGAPPHAPDVVAAAATTPALLDAARKGAPPVIHTNILCHAPGCADGGVWMGKSPVLAAMVAGNPLAAFCDGVKPQAGEPVFTKQYASASFGTSLASTLHAHGIDPLIMAGCPTSGCVRASAVDAVQHGLRAIVVRDRVGDRHDAPHEANLFDIDARYGDVVSLTEALDYLGGRH
jgi:maleamate amidohydrolase